MSGIGLGLEGDPDLDLRRQLPRRISCASTAMKSSGTSGAAWGILGMIPATPLPPLLKSKGPSVSDGHLNSELYTSSTSISARQFYLSIIIAESIIVDIQAHI